MATVKTASDRLTTQLGISAAEVRDRVRVLRDAGVLPRDTTRGRGAPHLDTKELVALLISLMAGDPVIASDVAPTRLMTGRFTHTRAEKVVDRASNTVTSGIAAIAPPKNDALKFGEMLVNMVDSATTQTGRNGLLQSFSEISVWGHGSMAAIKRTPDQAGFAHTWLYEPVPEADTPPPANLSLVRFRRLATADATILAVLADLVIDTRRHQEAKNRKAGSSPKDPAVLLSQGSSNSEPDLLRSESDYGQRENRGQAPETLSSAAGSKLKESSNVRHDPPGPSAA